MPNSLTTDQLVAAKAMITNGNVAGFYNFMSSQGYGYANLALGVVQCTLLTGGSTAQNFMVFQGLQQGVTLTPVLVGQIEVNMATQYADTLINNSRLQGGAVDSDWTYQEALAGHNAGFAALGLPPSLWTLYAPSQYLPPDQLQQNWLKTIDPAQAGGLDPAVNFITGFEAQMASVAANSASSNPQVTLQIGIWANTVTTAQETSGALAIGQQLHLASSLCLVDAVAAVQQNQTTAAAMLAQDPVVPPVAIASPARNSADFVTLNGNNTASISAGGTLSDLWLLQKNNPNGFSDPSSFYAAVLANNPQVADVNSIPAGISLNVPTHDGGLITYHYADGSSIGTNPATDEYHFSLPSNDGSGYVTNVDRAIDPTGGFTVTQVTTNSGGVVTAGSTARQATADSDLSATTSYTLNSTNTYDFVSSIGDHLIAYTAGTTSLGGAVPLGDVTSIDGVSLGEGTSASLNAAGVAVQQIVDGTVRLSLSADGTTLTLGNVSGAVQTSIVSNPDNGGAVQTDYVSSTDSNVQTITSYDPSGEVIGKTWVTPLVDTTPGGATFGQAVANTYSIKEEDATGAIVETGQRSFDPADGSFTDTLVGSSTAANPGGTIGQTTTDANGNVTTNLSTISINQLATSAQEFNDATALLQAIQHNQPIPALSSGLSLANDRSGQQVPALGGAAEAAGILASLQGLANAFKTGNVGEGVIDGASLFSQSVNAYVAVEYTSLNAAASDIGGLVTAAQDVSDVVPYLGLVDDLIQGDYTAAAGAAVGIAVTAALEGAEYGEAAGPIGAAVGFVAGLVFGEMFGPTPETPWGTADVSWDPSTQSIKVNSTGHAGGDQVVSSTLTTLVGDLQTLVTTFNGQVPVDEQIGIIAHRLGSLNYAPASAPDGSEPEAYSVTTIDPTTGAQLNGSLHFDGASGQALDAGVDDPAYFETLGQYYINNALARQAIAPEWEVQTVQLQAQNHLSNAGLSEVERDANAGQLASAIPAGATTEDWNPIGLDLGGGLAHTSLDDSGVQFNVDGTASLDAALSGQATTQYQHQTGWLNSQDGFLVLDKNLNGSIDNGDELFSNSQVAEQARGVASLATYDANGDGIIDSKDPVFSQLRVWQDSNGDGTAEAGEIHTLADLGITALNYQQGTYTKSDGSVHEMGTLTLQASTSGTSFQSTASGIQATSTNGQTTLYITQVGNLLGGSSSSGGGTSPGSGNTGGGSTSNQPIVETVTTNENVTAAIAVRGNGSNVQGLLDSIQVSNAPNAILSLAGVSNAQHGTVSYDATTGEVEFVPDSNYYGTDAGFDYQVDAGAYGQATVHVQVDVNHVDQGPHITGNQNTIDYIYGYQPKNISQESDATDWIGVPMFSPGYGYSEIDNSPTVAVSDPIGIGYAYRDQPIGQQTDPYSGTISVTDPDGPASGLTWSIVGQAHNGTASVDQNGNWTFSNAQDVGGTDAFIVQVKDASGKTDQIKVTVTLPDPPPTYEGNPIILDLNGTGFDFQSLGSSNVFFTSATDGWAHRTAWFSGGNGVLAFDKYGDGIVHDSSQIDFKDLSSTAQTDLQGLGAFDTNHDGVIDKNDANWSKLGVWVDANDDGVCEAGEYKTLDQLGIASISLKSNNQFSLNQGVTVYGETTFTRANGTTGQAADVALPSSNDVLASNGDGTTHVAQVAQGNAAQPITVGAGNNLILGNAGDNTISFGDGNNVVETGAGNDFITGGNGSNSVESGDGKDTIAVGNGNNTVILGAGDKYVFTGNGNNVISGGSGDDIYIAGSGNNLLYAGSGNSLIKAGDGSNTLLGGTGHNELFAGNGSNTFSDGGGIADMYAGTGDSTFVVSNAKDTITVQAGGHDTVKTSIDWTLGVNQQVLWGTGASALTLHGNDAGDQIIGNGAADTLIGGLGNDTLADSGGAATLVGGGGDDTFVVTNAATSVQASAGWGGTVKSSVSYSLPQNVRTLIGTGSASLTLTGGNQDGITIQANAGDDMLVAGSGIATLMGGSGNDVFVVDNTADVVHTQAAGGLNTIETSVSYTASDNVTVLSGTGSADVVLTGNALDDVITANSGNDTLVAGSGNDVLVAGAGLDTLVGGSGSDLYQLGASSANVTLGSGSGHVNGGDGTIAISGPGAGTVSVALGNGTDRIDLSGSVNTATLSLGSGNDRITLGNGTTTVTATDGNDTVVAGDGSDVITMGAGADTLTLGNGNDKVTTKDGAGTTDGVSTGNGNSILSMDQGNDQLSVGNGSNTITAGDGADSLTLGTGGNVVALGNGTDSVVARDAAGTTSTYQLGNGADNVTLGNGADSLTLGSGQNTVNAGNGNDAITTADAAGTADVFATGNGNSKITLGQGNDQIRVGNGSNVIVAGNGTDVMTLGTGSDQVTLGDGADTVKAQDVAGTSSTYRLGNGNSMLTLGQGSDQLIVGNGNNTITAGDGADALTLGTGGNQVTLGNGSDIVKAQDAAGAASVYQLGNGNSKITLGQGNDQIGVGNGSNVIVAGNGADVVALGTGGNQVTLGDGFDTVQAQDAAGVSSTYRLGNGNDKLALGQGNEQIGVGNGSNTITAGEGADSLTLGTAGNQVTLGNGTDSVLAQDASGTTSAYQLGNGADSVTLGDGADSLTLGRGNDNVQTGNGNDVVTTADTAGTADVVSTGNGNSEITLGQGNDQVGVGNGSNVIVAGNGTDVVTLGTGSNQVTLGNGADTVKAHDAVAASSSYQLGNGADNVTLGDGADSLTLGNGKDCVQVGNGNDTIKTADAAGTVDVIKTGNGNSKITLGQGSDQVTAGNGNNTITAGDGTDSLTLGTGSNQITLGNGSDTVKAQDAAGTSSVYQLGTGKDMVQAGNGNDVITTADAAGTADVVATGNGNSKITLGQGNDQVVVGNGSNVILAGNGTDVVTLGAGGNQVTLGNGADVVKAQDAAGTSSSYQLGNGADSVTLGDGADALTLGTGKDTVQAGNGNDTIKTADAAATVDVVKTGNGNSKITLGQGSDQVTAGNGSNTITAGDGADSLTLGTGGNQVTLGNGTDSVAAQDAAGTSSTYQLGNGADSVTVGNGADTLTLGSGKDTVQAGNGNDTISAGNGTDSVVVGNGSNAIYLGNGNDGVTTGTGANAIHLGIGQDVITNKGGSDTLYLSPAVSSDSLRFSRSGNDLLITEGSSGGSVRVVNGYTSSAAGLAGVVAGNGNYGVQLDDHSYSFAAGDGRDSVWGGNGNDTVALGNGSDVVQLGYGNDSIAVGNGNDQIAAGSGNDAFTTGNGNSSIQLGWGNDTISVGTGSNYIIAGDGADSVKASDASTSYDTVVLGNGKDTVAMGNGRDTVLTGNGNDTVSVGSGSNVIELGNGRDQVNASDAAGNSNFIEVGCGNDQIVVGQGSNTIEGGSGADSVVGGDGNNTVVLGYGADSIRLGNGSNQVQTSDFWGGSVAVAVGNGNNCISLGDGNDTVSAGNGNNTVSVGLGHSQIALGNGHDQLATYGGVDNISVGTGQTDVWNHGAEDNIILNTGAHDQLWFQEDGWNLDIKVMGSNEEVVVHNWFAGSQISQLTTSDGEVISAAGINRLVQAMASLPAPTAAQTSYSAKEQQGLTSLMSTVWHPKP